MQVFTDDGACIDVSVDGRQRDVAVVLIHGFPLTRAIWDAQSELLRGEFFVVRPDLRGAGASSVPEGPYLMERLAADVAATLDVFGIERGVLVGHSMGGYVALAFARMFTERVAGLALVTSRLRADTSEEASARRTLADRIERENSVEPVLDAYLPRLLSPRTLAEKPSVVERAYELARLNEPAGIASTLRGIALRASSEDVAPDLEVPVLTIAGGMDRVVQLDEARAVAESFPAAERVTCEESGHLPMLEEPRRVGVALHRWLQRITG